MKNSQEHENLSNLKLYGKHQGNGKAYAYFDIALQNCANSQNNSYHNNIRIFLCFYIIAHCTTTSVGIQ